MQTILSTRQLRRFSRVQCGLVGISAIVLYCAYGVRAIRAAGGGVGPWSLLGSEALSVVFLSCAVWAINERRKWTSNVLSMAAILSIIGVYGFAEGSLAGFFNDPTFKSNTTNLAISTPFAVVAVSLLSLSIVLRSLNRLVRVAQLCTLGVLVISALSLLARLFLIREPWMTTAAGAGSALTELALGILALALLALPPHRSWMHQLLAPTIGGEAARRLLPIVTLSPAALCWLALQGSRHELFSNEFRLVIISVFSALLMAALMIWSARALDFTEDRHRAEQKVLFDKLQSADQHLRLSRDLLLVANLSGRIETVSPSWTEVLGWSEEDLVGSSFADLLHPDDVEKTERGVRRLAEGLPTIRSDNRYRHRDGSYRWISWTGSPDGERFYASGRDITEEKKREVALAEAELRLRRSEKLESIGQLTGGIAHDFNNILQGIQANLELIECLQVNDRQDDLADYVAEAQQSVDRAGDLTQQLLAFARRQALTASTVDPNSLIEDLVVSMRRTLGSDIEIVLRTSNYPLSVVCDAEQLETALVNLIVNAREAMPCGGRLEIATERARFDLDPPYASVSDPGDYVSISITDTGVGMSPQACAQACEPFYTTKPAGRGAGLGLSQVYGFIRQSGGTVDLRSIEGQGTSVVLSLPERQAEQAEIASPRTGEDNGKYVHTVLIVEDEPRLRDMTVGYLQKFGWNILEAANGHKALEVAQNAARLDLLLTDIGLPGLNGRLLADAVRVQHPQVPIIFMSGYAGEALADWKLDPGMRVISKPFRLKALASLLTETIGSNA